MENPTLFSQRGGVDSIVFHKANDEFMQDIPDPEIGNVTISCWPFGCKKALCFTWDDGFRWQVEAISKVFDYYGYKTTFYLPTFRFWTDQKHIDTYRNVCQGGHEIGSHTKNHVPLSTIPLDSARYEIVQSAIDIKKYLGYKPVSFAHPERKFNAGIDEIVLATYFTSRFSSILKYPQRKVHTILSTDTSDSFIAEFEEFYEGNDTWMVYSGHGISSKTVKTTGIYQPVDSIHLDNYLKYIKTNYNDEVWVTAYDNIAIYEYIRNNVTLQYGENFVFVNSKNIESLLSTYNRPHFYLSLELDKTKVSVVANEAIVNEKTVGTKFIVTIDLRKGKYIFYNKI